MLLLEEGLEEGELEASEASEEVPSGEVREDESMSGGKTHEASV